MVNKRTVLLMLSAFVCCQSGTFAQPCQQRQAMPDFDLSKFSGRWYGLLSIDAGGGYGVRCFQEKYTRVAKEPMYNVISAYMMSSQFDFQEDYDVILNGTASLAEYSSQGKLSFFLQLETEPSHITNHTRVDHVLDTDYQNYAIVVSCRGEHESFFVHTRQPLVRTGLLQEIFHLINSMGWNMYDIKWTEQSCGALSWTSDELGKSS